MIYKLICFNVLISIIPDRQHVPNTDTLEYSGPATVRVLSDPPIPSSFDPSSSELSQPDMKQLID